MRKGKLLTVFLSLGILFAYPLGGFATETGTGTAQVQYVPSKDMEQTEGGKENTPNQYVFTDLTRPSTDSFYPKTYPQTNSRQNLFFVFCGVGVIGSVLLLCKYEQEERREKK